MKASLYDVEALVQTGRLYNADTKVALEVSVLSVSESP